MRTLHPLIVKFENRLNDLVDEYLKDGVSSSDILHVLKYHCDEKELLEREVALQQKAVTR
jgi:hypothetical protein